MSNIVFGRSTAATIYYDVLRHLDLRDDAASIHDGASASWSKRLVANYPRGAASDRVQILPLVTPGLPQLLAILRSGDEFEKQLADVVETHATEFRIASARYGALDEVAGRITDLLHRARTALFADVGETSPPLMVLEVPALGRHGRGAAIDGHQVVGVAMDGPWEDVFCLTFHEITHAVSDRFVRVARDVERFTEKSAPGYERHRALERAALERADEVVRRAVPELADHHRRWVAMRIGR